MTPQEKSTGALLASVYALRLFGMFLLLPVFSLYAQSLPGGTDKVAVSMAFGIYGLTQAFLQLPLGMASDYIGRKPVIYFGLALFAAGSFWAAFAHDIQSLAWARALQGAGAVSAAVTALLADLTREEVRTRAMAIIGISIGLTFSASLMIAPFLNPLIGVNGMFALTGILAAAAIVLIHFFVPDPPKLQTHDNTGARWQLLPSVLKDTRLWPLHFGIFAVHAAQMALFMALPAVLETHSAFAGAHWKIYLPATIAGMILMVPAVVAGETRGLLKPVLAAAVLVLAAAQGLLALFSGSPWGIAAAMLLYFAGLNIVEAILPSWVSKIAHLRSKGTAMGIYNTAMSFGLFAGSLAGGFILKNYGIINVFVCCALLMLLWAAAVAFSDAPGRVYSLVFRLPENWQNRPEALQRALKNIDGISEAAVGSDGQTLYIKADRHLFNENDLQQILHGA